MPTQTLLQVLEAAVQLHQQGRLEDAARLYRQIIAAQPKSPDAMNLLAMVEYQHRKFDVALSLIDQALALAPEQPSFHMNRGLIFGGMNRWQESAAECARAIQLQSNYSEAYNNLGSALQALNRMDEAIEAHRVAMTLRPELPEPHFNLGVALARAGKLEESMASYRRTVALAPGHFRAYGNLGIALFRAGRNEEAIATWRQALRVNPNFAEAYVNIGIVCLRMDRLEDVVDAMQRALAISPNLPDARNNLASALKDLGRYSDATATLREMIATGLDQPETHFNLAWMLLLCGDFEAGWKEYEWRRQTSAFDARNRVFDKPRWDGLQEIAGKRVLIHPEQGAGDTIQFVRYLPLLAERGAKIILEAPPSVYRLLSSAPGAAEVVREGGKLPEYDFEFPLLSLAHLFETRLETIPAKVPYLHAEAALQEKWKSRVPVDGRLKVGICWSGNPKQANNLNREIQLAELAPLAEIENIWFCSLQKGAPAEQAAHPPAGMDLVDWTSELEDFADTAALMTQLDLILTVDTSVAHLGGALGLETWVLTAFAADWRWLLERTDSPWYPTMRLFRQSVRKQWEPVVAAVGRELRGRVLRNRGPRGGEIGGSFHVASCGAELMVRVTLEQSLELAVLEHQSGRLPQAERMYRQILGQYPADPDALHLLGVALFQQGRADSGLELVRQASALRPADARILGNLSLILTSLCKWDEAIAAARSALAISPVMAEVHNTLGNALRGADKPDAALAAYRQAIACKRDYADAYNNMGVLLRHRGELDEAIAAYQTALRTRPDFVEAANNLGEALRPAGRVREAVAELQRAIELRPDFAEAHNNLGLALGQLGQADEAIVEFREALRIRENFSEALNNLGNSLKDQGEIEEAIACFDRAVAVAPGNSAMHSNLVYSLTFHPGYDAAAIYSQLQHWEAKHAAPLATQIQPHLNQRDPNRRLRIGYVSPDFRDHVQRLFTTPVLSSHHHGQFEIFCYANSAPDDKTGELWKLADEWRTIAGLSDSQVAQMIRADGIDVLVDLTLHMAGNRLLVFAHKPAPVQITWLGYPGSTGLKTMDVRISDPYLDPRGSSDAFASERTVRLPSCFWCYQALSEESAVGRLPAERNGVVTFGCLNNFTKVNGGVLDAWGQVLARVENSRLLLLAPAGQVRQRVKQRLRNFGVAESRTEFIDRQPREAYLQLYQRIDLCLDTFPYNGHTTTLDGLWMGVPIVTLAGKTAFGRGGVSLLSNLQLTDWIASTAPEFVDLAVKKAADLTELAKLRRSLRQRLENSPIMNARQFTRDLEAIYRQAWQDWCENDAASDRAG